MNSSRTVILPLHTYMEYHIKAAAEIHSFRFISSAQLNSFLLLHITLYTDTKPQQKLSLLPPLPSTPLHNIPFRSITPYPIPFHSSLS